MECSRCNAILHAPVHGPSEDVGVIAVQTEDKAPVNHDPDVIEPSDDLPIAPAEILALAGAGQGAGRKRLESDEYAAESRGRRLFDKVVAKNGVYGCRPLKDAAHTSHTLEQRSGETGMPKQMIVEEVEMATRQALDLGQRLVHLLRVERAPAREETVLVAEGAVVRTAP